MAETIRYFTLNTGDKIPSIGLGTYKAVHGIVADPINTAVKGYAPLGSPYKGPVNQTVLNNPVIASVAAQLGKSPAQVALRWGLELGHSVLPNSTNEERIKQNFDIFYWTIPYEMLSKFSDIMQVRLGTGASFVHEKFGAYRTLEELWDGEI